jgi:hypothetical protein
MERNHLLACMLCSYFIPIIIVFVLYQDNPSISSIICNDRNKAAILISMILMGIFTLLYENQRKCRVSIYIIAFLLFGIYGVICKPETDANHLIFAYISFASICIFMAYHCYAISNRFLYALLAVQAVLVGCVYIYPNHFFMIECGMLLVFAVYYLYLHYIE